MKKFAIEIKWGIIFTVVDFLWITLEKIMGWHGKHIDQYAFNTWFFIIPATHIYISAIKNKRDKFYNSKMNWTQGFSTGLGITAIVIALNPLVKYVHTNLISPEFFTNAIRYASETGKMSEEQVAKIYNLKSFIIQGLLRTFIYGVVVSAIVAIFVKKK